MTWQSAEITFAVSDSERVPTQLAFCFRQKHIGRTDDGAYSIDTPRSKSLWVDKKKRCEVTGCPLHIDTIAEVWAQFSSHHLPLSSFWIITMFLFVNSIPCSCSTAATAVFFGTIRLDENGNLGKKPNFSILLPQHPVSQWSKKKVPSVGRSASSIWTRTTANKTAA